MTRFPSSIPRFFERLFNFFERLVLQPGNPLCVAPSFLETQNAILKHTTFCNLAKAHIYLQYKELAVLHFFFVFYQGVDGVNCLQDILKHWMCFSTANMTLYHSGKADSLLLYLFLQTGWHSGETLFYGELETSCKIHNKVPLKVVAKKKA